MIAINDSLPAFCNFDNTPLPHAFDHKPHLYIACANAYIYGKTHGLWIDATQEVEEITMQIYRMLAGSSGRGIRKYFIRAHHGFYGLKIERHADIEDVHEKALFISEHGERGATLLNYFGL